MNIPGIETGLAGLFVPAVVMSLILWAIVIAMVVALS